VVAFFVLPSCENDGSTSLNEEVSLKTSSTTGILYFGHKTFTRGTGTPVVITQLIENPDFEHFEDNFILHIQNGKDSKTRVSSAEIWIDGVLVVGHSDFSKKATSIIKQLNGLTPESILEVKLNSSPGSFIDIWIEGTLKKDHALITNLGGNFSFLNGLITFKIPPEAIESPTFISVRDITSELPDEIKSKVGLAFDFLPDGMQFAHPISVELKVPESIELHQSAFLGPLDIESGSLLWYPSEVLLNERIISSEINHFSSWSALWASYFEPKTYSYTLLNLPTNLEGYHGEPSETYEYLLNNDVKRAFNKWEAYSKSAGITFKATTSVDAEISIKFLSKSDLRLFYELRYDNKWAGMVLWDLFSERKAIILNDFYFWHVTTDLILNIYDTEYIEHVVTHEIGHFFGLKDYKFGSPYYNNSIMGYGVGLPIPLCDIDVKNIKNEYPEVNCAYGSASEMRILDLNNLGYPGQIMNDLKLIVTDENGFGVPNVPVYIRYDLIEYFNNIPHTIVETDANGIATINNVKLPEKLGNFKIRATTLLGGETGIDTLVEYFNVATINNQFIYRSEFSGDLSDWIPYNGSWLIQNGVLLANYGIGCGSIYCSQADLILKDQFQPSGNWKISVDFTYAGDSYHAASSAAMILWVSPTKKFRIGVGNGGFNNWGNSQLESIGVGFGEWDGTWYKQINKDVNYIWNPKDWHTMTVEKTGNNFKVYVNDVYLWEYTDTYLNGSGKIGLQTYGPKTYDNFVIMTNN
jgi:hypothetical protein